MAAAGLPGFAACLAVATAAALVEPVGAIVIYVDDDAAPAGDGLSWAGALRFLQDALDLAERSGGAVTEIRVAQGTQHPDRSAAAPQGSASRLATFDLLAGVVLRGGYAGVGADNPDARDPAAFPSVLSGNIGQPALAADNSFHVLRAQSVAGAVLDGFVVEAARADGSGVSSQGGGILIQGGSVALLDCLFQGNFAQVQGGGACCMNGSAVTVAGCAFAGNQVVNQAGGGLCCDDSSTVLLSACHFEGNSAEQGGGASTAQGASTVRGCTFLDNGATFEGGGLWCGTGPTTVTDCHFEGNLAPQAGGGLRYEGDGTISGSTFISNGTAGGGGGVSNEGSALYVNCRFLGNLCFKGLGGGFQTEGSSNDPVLVNCLFSGNFAVHGGGIGVAFEAGSAAFVNCAVSGNLGATTGGVVVSTPGSGQHTALTNCIVAGNESLSNPGQNEVELHDSTQVSHTCVLGLVFPGPGNIAEDPRFADPDGPDGVAGTLDDDLSLLPASPGIDAGDNSALPGCVTDLAGRERFADDPAQPDSGAGEPPIVDLGPLEALAPRAPDCNANGQWDGCDLNGGGSSDCNGNLIPDECDIAGGTSGDCDRDGVPDECGLVDCDGNAVPDQCDPDCNANSMPDACDIAAGRSPDLNANGVPDECEADCNGNGLPDFIEILFQVVPDCNRNQVPDGCDVAAGASADCNGNTIPDECDIAGGTAPDCNRNGAIDACDIAGGASPDLNSNGVPDECEADCNGNGLPDFIDLALGLSQDCDGNGVPDECQNDCNGNGIDDACDLDDRTSADCNGNAIPDECDIDEGLALDCNRNGVPDACDVAAQFSAASSMLSPIGGSSPQSFTIRSPPEASGPVTLSFSASADLNLTTEWIDVTLNGGALGPIFQSGANDCANPPNQAKLMLTARAFNALVAGGDAVIDMLPTSTVSSTACGGQSFVSVAVGYAVQPASGDADGDGVPDECQCPADVAQPQDGTVDVLDLVAVVLAWGRCPPACPADVSGDGGVGVEDLVAVVLAWGACP